MNKSARYWAIAIIGFTALLIAGAVGMHVFKPLHPHIEPDRSRYPLCGADFSAHNGPVDFQRLADESELTFVYLKATEGADFRDSLFMRHYHSARNAGLHTGAYHFFRFDKDGEAQALNIIATLDTLDLDLPLAIDVEEWGNPAQVPTELIVERIKTLRAYLSARGIPSIIYTNKNGYARFVRHHIPEAEIWICSFTSPPVGSAVNWRLWQHSHLGRLPGVKGRVDLNTFNGSRSDYESWRRNAFSASRR